MTPLLRPPKRAAGAVVRRASMLRSQVEEVPGVFRNAEAGGDSGAPHQTGRAVEFSKTIGESDVNLCAGLNRRISRRSMSTPLLGRLASAPGVRMASIVLGLLSDDLGDDLGSLDRARLRRPSRSRSLRPHPVFLKPVRPATPSPPLHGVGESVAPATAADAGQMRGFTSAASSVPRPASTHEVALLA